MILVREDPHPVATDRYDQEVGTRARQDDPIRGRTAVDRSGEHDQWNGRSGGRRSDRAAEVAVAVEDAEVLVQRKELAARRAPRGRTAPAPRESAAPRRACAPDESSDATTSATSVTSYRARQVEEFGDAAEDQLRTNRDQHETHE